MRPSYRQRNEIWPQNFLGGPPKERKRVDSACDEKLTGALVHDLLGAGKVEGLDTTSSLFTCLSVFAAARYAAGTSSGMTREKKKGERRTAGALGSDRRAARSE